MNEPPPYSKLEETLDLKPLTPITVESLRKEIDKVNAANRDTLNKLELARKTFRELEQVIASANRELSTPPQSPSPQSFISLESSSSNQRRIPHSYDIIGLEEAIDFLGLKEDCSETDEEIVRNFNTASIVDVGIDFRRRIRGSILVVALSRPSSSLLQPYIASIYRQEASAHITTIGMIDLNNIIVQDGESLDVYPDLLKSLGIGASLPFPKKADHSNNTKTPLTFDIVELEEAYKVLNLPDEEEVSNRELADAVEKALPKVHGAIITACLNRIKAHFFRPLVERLIITEVEAYFDTLTLPTNITTRKCLDGIIRGGQALLIAVIPTFREACKILKVNEHASSAEILAKWDEFDVSESFQACGAIVRICASKEHLEILTPTLRSIILQELQAYLHELELPDLEISPVDLLITELSHLQDNTPFEPTRLLAELKELESELLVSRASLAAKTREKNKKEEEQKKVQEREKEKEAKKPRHAELEKAQVTLKRLEGLEEGMREELESIKIMERDQIEKDKEAARLALPVKKINRACQTDRPPIISTEAVPTSIDLVPLLGELSEDISAQITETFNTMLEMRDLLGFPEINYPIRMDEGGGRRRSN